MIADHDMTPKLVQMWLRVEKAKQIAISLSLAVSGYTLTLQNYLAVALLHFHVRAPLFILCACNSCDG